MVKGLGILIGGIFIGAVGAEILHKKYPDALSKLCSKTSEMTSKVKEAFKSGYACATQSEPVGEATA